MKTLTLKQPWASLIVEGVKDIENRSWELPEKYKGQRVLVHASKTAEYDCCASSPFAALFPLTRQYKVLTSEQKHNIINNSCIRSAIIGSVVLVDCVKNHDSIWAEKDSWNWILEYPIKFDVPIVNVKGKLSFWEYELHGCTSKCDTNSCEGTFLKEGEVRRYYQMCAGCDRLKNEISSKLRLY